MMRVTDGIAGVLRLVTCLAAAAAMLLLPTLLLLPGHALPACTRAFAGAAVAEGDATDGAVLRVWLPRATSTGKDDGSARATRMREISRTGILRALAFSDDQAERALLESGTQIAQEAERYRSRTEACA